jgi:PhnB protein
VNSVSIYLNFPGTTEEAFNFYKSIFGGDFSAIMRFDGIPDGEKLSPEEKNKIMHISLPLSNGVVLMATDALESMGQHLEYGNNFYISITTDSKEEADKYFSALSQGANIEMPMQDTFWGAYYGSLRDKYGIGWMLNYDYPKQ